MTSKLRRIVRLTIIAIAVAAAVATIAQLSRDRAYAIGPSSPTATETAVASKGVPPCSVETIAGDWAARFTGKTADGLDQVGIATFHQNKDGTNSTHIWANIGGTTFLEIRRTGRITVDADCTTTQTWDDGGPSAKCVILRRGREIWATYDAPGFSTVILKRIDEPL